MIMTICGCLKPTVLNNSIASRNFISSCLFSSLKDDNTLKHYVFSFLNHIMEGTSNPFLHDTYIIGEAKATS
jgi:hypothetical protein